jgi:hypothetical protein
MKELILITISIFTVLIAANLETDGAKLDMGSIKVTEAANTASAPVNISRKIELKSAKGDWNASPSPQGPKAVFRNSVKLVNFNDAGDALKTAELR